MCRSALGLFLTLAAATPCAAQFVTSFGATAASIRHDGFTSGQALTLAPRLEWRRNGSTLLFAGAFSMHEAGDLSLQGGPRLYAVSEPVVGPFRFGLDSRLDGTVRSEAPWTASAEAVAEAVLLGERGGVAAGAGLLTGGLQGAGPTSAGRGRFRAWNTWGGFEALAALEPVWLPDATYTDLSVRGGALWKAVEALGAVFYRFGSGVRSRGAVQGALRLYAGSISALEIAFGSYLEDPVQALPAGEYVTIGFRLFNRASRTPPVSPLGEGVYEAQPRGVVLQFQLPEASVVEIAGDWNGWHAEPMERVGSNGWKIVVPLERGIYHFNVRIDGTRWMVPDGVPSLDDGYGGKQGVLIVM